MRSTNSLKHDLLMQMLRRQLVLNRLLRATEPYENVRVEAEVDYDITQAFKENLEADEETRKRFNLYAI
jgi:hypothetical protein